MRSSKAGRVPAYVGIPVVLGCGLVGYAISLLIPLHPSPAAPAGDRPAAAALPSANLPAHPEQPTPDMRTVERAPEPPKDAGETAATGALQEAAAPAPQAQQASPKRPKRIPRPPQPEPAEKAQGPVEALWSVFTAK